MGLNKAFEKEEERERLVRTHQRERQRDQYIPITQRRGDRQTDRQTDRLTETDREISA